MLVPYKKRKALVIGGTGRLGRLIVHCLKQAGHDVIYTHHENGFADSVKYDFFNDNAAEIPGFDDIEIIVFAAKVEFEKDPKELEDAMMRFVMACGGNKRIVYVSSDAVFDGEKPGGLYAESDPVCPRNQYGINLVICETIVKLYCPNHCIARPACIYGYSMGELDPRLEEGRKVLESSKPYYRFGDMFKSFLSYGQTAQWIARIATERISISDMDFRGVIHISGYCQSMFGFTLSALVALGCTHIANLRENGMPVLSDGLFLKNTSLDSSLAECLLEDCPRSISTSLRIYR